MCYNGKCLHCIEVETGSLIWAIFKVVLSGLSSLMCIGSFIFVNVTAKEELAPQMYNNPAYGNGVVMAVGVYNVMLIVALTISAIEFMFTMFLLVGVIKKKVGYVKSYFIYGVVKLIISFLIIVGISANSDADSGIFFGIALFFVFHGLILLMVRNTYMKFNGGEIINKFMYKPLV